jgi:hypothetical protein
MLINSAAGEESGPVLDLSYEMTSWLHTSSLGVYVYGGLMQGS